MPAVILKSPAGIQAADFKFTDNFFRADGPLTVPPYDAIVPAVGVNVPAVVSKRAVLTLPAGSSQSNFNKALPVGAAGAYAEYTIDTTTITATPISGIYLFLLQGSFANAPYIELFKAAGATQWSVTFGYRQANADHPTQSGIILPSVTGQRVGLGYVQGASSAIYTVGGAQHQFPVPGFAASQITAEWFMNVGSAATTTKLTYSTVHAYAWHRFSVPP